jgi:hypothetical protein
MSLAGEHDDTSRVVCFGDTEGIAVPIHHQNPCSGRAQFVVPGPVRMPGRVQGERQRDHPRRGHLPRGAADETGAVAPPALDQRKARFVQRRDDLRPRGVLPGRGSGRTGASDPVRLRDQCRHGAERERGVSDGEHVRRVRRAARPVGQHCQEGRRPGWFLQHHARGPGAGHDLHGVHRTG